MPHLTLILGGARSGKSRLAETMAQASGLERIYVATAEPWDAEMAARIQRHRLDREGKGWRTVEEPCDLEGTLRREAGPSRVLLVDCLTLWLTNLMMAKTDIDLAQRGLLDRLPDLSGRLIFVSNEVGLGGIAATPMARAFADHAGRLHQSLAALADQVILSVAGLPLQLKPGLKS